MSVHSCFSAALELPAESDLSEDRDRLGVLDEFSPRIPPEAGYYRGSPSTAGLLVWLQNTSARPGMDWLALESFMLQLGRSLSARVGEAATRYAAVSMEALDGDCLVLASQRWWLQLGPVDPGRELIAIEREGYLIAALAPVEGGRLGLAVFRPLDAYSLSLICRLGAHLHPRLGVEMRVNNWELTLDCAVGSEAVADGSGRATLGYWPRGLHGIIADDARRPLPVSNVAAQLLTFEGYLGSGLDTASEVLTQRTPLYLC